MLNPFFSLISERKTQSLVSQRTGKSTQASVFLIQLPKKIMYFADVTAQLILVTQ